VDITSILLSAVEPYWENLVRREVIKQGLSRFSVANPPSGPIYGGTVTLRLPADDDVARLAFYGSAASLLEGIWVSGGGPGLPIRSFGPPIDWMTSSLVGLPREAFTAARWSSTRPNPFWAWSILGRSHRVSSSSAMESRRRPVDAELLRVPPVWPPSGL
jgi:hypothetical protein